MAWNLVEIRFGHLPNISLHCSATSVSSVTPSPYDFLSVSSLRNPRNKTSIAASKCGTGCPFVFLCWNRQHEGRGWEDIGGRSKLERKTAVGGRRTVEICHTEESHTSLGYLTSWHLSSHTEMTLASLSKHTVCLQVSNMKYPTVARTYISRVGNSKWCLQTLSESDSCRLTHSTNIGYDGLLS